MKICIEISEVAFNTVKFTVILYLYYFSTHLEVKDGFKLLPTHRAYASRSWSRKQASWSESCTLIPENFILEGGPWNVDAVKVILDNW